MQVALNQLGYRTHHMREVFKRGDIALWAQAGRGDFSGLDKALEGYNATVDFPSVCSISPLRLLAGVLITVLCLGCVLERAASAQPQSKGALCFKHARSLLCVVWCR